MTESSSKPWCPQRVADALRSAKDFGKYREARVFKFLHLFSGPRDVIGEKLVEKGKKENLRVEVCSIDLKIKHSIPEKNLAADLTAEQPYNSFLEWTKEGEFDGSHSGFPCNTFSVARWNPMPGHPGPLRSGAEIYGLAGNSKEKQEQADQGTLLAIRSVWIAEAQVASSERRHTPAVATLENPPGNEEKGSAWLLPEVKKFMANNSETADFNTCAYMETKKRWKKAGRFGGKLPGLAGLSKPCMCPAWVVHEALVGANKTSAAAEYPDKLAEAYAELVIRVWKKQLQLEWWRNQTDLTTREVEMLRAAENKRKRDDRPPGRKVAPRPSLLIPHERRDEVAPGDAMHDNVDEEMHMPGPLKPSKKETRELENHNAIGGMRNPTRAVDRLASVGSFGRKMVKWWVDFVKEYPEALVTAQLYGSPVCQPIEDVTEAWRKVLKEKMKTHEIKSDMVMKENWEFTSPLQADMWDAWHKHSGDPEKYIGKWAREGCPLGMECEIQTCGIFPQVDDQAEPEIPEVEAIAAKKNYVSMLENKEDAEKEILRYVEKGFAIVKPLEWAQQIFERGTVSKLACITKVKEDQTKKVRIIVDLLRSHGNLRCRVPERIVLPRAVDLVEMGRGLDAHADDLWRESQPCDERTWDMEVVMVDLSDAFCHFPINKREIRHALAPGLEPNTVIAFTAMLFGFKAAPLIMGRLSSCLARLWQSLLRPCDGALQLYVDDAIVLLNGTMEFRDLNLALLLYTASAFGVQIAFHKGERGRRTTWIGIQFEIDPAEVAMVLTIPGKMLKELREALEAWKDKGMISVRHLRTITGKASWVAGILPRWRWIVSIMYAVLASHERDVASGAERRRARDRDDDRVKEHLIPVKRVELPRLFLLEAIQQAATQLIRKEPFVEKKIDRGIITDACPLGLGAIIVTRTSTGQLKPYEAFYSKITQVEANMLGVPYGESDSQSAMEAYALLRAMQKWGSKLKKRGFFIKSDSMVALAVTRKLASSTPALNFVGAEMSILLSKLNCGKLQLIHVPGQLNKEADWLSRMEEGKEMPPLLRGIKIEEFKLEDKNVFHLPDPGSNPELWGHGETELSSAFERLA